MAVVSVCWRNEKREKNTIIQTQRNQKHCYQFYGVKIISHWTNTPQANTLHCISWANCMTKHLLFALSLVFLKWKKNHTWKCLKTTENAWIMQRSKWLEQLQTSQSRHKRYAIKLKVECSLGFLSVGFVLIWCMLHTTLSSNPLSIFFSSQSVEWKWDWCFKRDVQRCVYPVNYVLPWMEWTTYYRQTETTTENRQNLHHTSDCRRHNNRSEFVRVNDQSQILCVNNTINNSTSGF